MRARIARGLETGAWTGATAHALELVWAKLSARRLERPLVVPAHMRVVSVGGATIGGSCKTPLALATVIAIAASGESVGLVGHGYGARADRPRLVLPGDDPRIVGDEALACARRLDGVPGVSVVVAPTRQGALDLLASLARVAVIDGALQLAPRRSHLALLAVDAARPWGAEACPPRGDLNAPLTRLLENADLVVAVGPVAPSFTLERRVAWARTLQREPTMGATRLPWEHVRELRVGLYTAMARPLRFVSALAALGVHPVRHLRGPDHAPPSKELLARASRGARDVALWLVTDKCSTWLGESFGGRPVAVAHIDLIPDAALIEELAKATLSS